jgi:putative SOS response-associated peptidase YedK
MGAFKHTRCIILVFGFYEWQDTPDREKHSGYASDDALGTSTDTWDNATFASLGVTPGTYVWTWGTDADQSFTRPHHCPPLSRCSPPASAR